MSQRLLDANQCLVDSASGAIERAQLLQDRAILLSRLGRIDDAAVAIEQALACAPADAPANITLRFDYVRSIRSYFAKRFAEALDLMVAVRARALADGHSVLRAECESALALYAQREGDVRSAASYARSVLATADATLESRYRAFLALASLHQDAYDFEAASRLFKEAEDVVRELGDDIATASWQQRIALTLAADVRQAAALGQHDAKALRAAVEALKKSIRYAAGLEGGPDTTLDHLLLAEMNVLQKKHREALTLYDEHLPSAEGDGFLHEVTVALADRARCRIELGEVDAGYAELVAVLRRVDESTPADIRAIVHDNMAGALDRLGHVGEADQHRKLGRMAWETYAHGQREARRLLNDNAPETLH